MSYQSLSGTKAHLCHPSRSLNVQTNCSGSSKPNTVSNIQVPLLWLKPQLIIESDSNCRHTHTQTLGCHLISLKPLRINIQNHNQHLKWILEFHTTSGKTMRKSQAAGSIQGMVTTLQRFVATTEKECPRRWTQGCLKSRIGGFTQSFRCFDGGSESEHRSYHLPPPLPPIAGPLPPIAGPLPPPPLPSSQAPCAKVQESPRWQKP